MTDFGDIATCSRARPRRIASRFARWLSRKGFRPGGPVGFGHAPELHRV
jgi:hypothetical protein